MATSKEELKEYHKEYSKEYSQRPENKERKKEYQKGYYKRTDVKMKIKIRNQNFREKNGGVFLRLRFEVFKRDDFTCQYCGRNVKEDKIKIQCDHIQPKSKGGFYTKENLITSCEDCNKGKGDIILKMGKKNKIKK